MLSMRVHFSIALGLVALTCGCVEDHQGVER